MRIIFEPCRPAGQLAHDVAVQQRLPKSTYAARTAGGARRHHYLRSIVSRHGRRGAGAGEARRPSGPIKCSAVCFDPSAATTGHLARDRRPAAAAVEVEVPVLSLFLATPWPRALLSEIKIYRKS